MKLFLDTARVDELRVRRGLLKQELAQRAGIHVNTLAGALNGQPIRLTTARRLAEALAVPIKRILISGTVEHRRAGRRTPVGESGEAGGASGARAIIEGVNRHECLLG